MAVERLRAVPLLDLVSGASHMEADAFSEAYGFAFLLWMPSMLKAGVDGLAKTQQIRGPAAYEPSDPQSFQVYPLTRQRDGSVFVIVGRETTCDVIVDHGSVSSAHCCLNRSETGEWSAFDAGSTNGTFVNEIDAPAMGSTLGIPVTPMTRIRMGTFEASYMDPAQIQLLAKGIGA